MLKLTKKADYGLIALKHLAVRALSGGDQPSGSAKEPSASAKEIADTYGIPLPLLSKILQKLTKLGFLHAEHGTNGGYRLAKDARQITTLDVIRAIDGPILLTVCFTEHGECSHTEKCIVREPLRKVHEGILKLLSSITIFDMSRDDFQVSGCDGASTSADAHLYGLTAAVTAPPPAEKLA